jgi:hypothetical protein
VMFYFCRILVLFACFQIAEHQGRLHALVIRYKKRPD